MRKLLVTVAVSAMLVALPGTAVAGQAEAPSAACNAGTMNAHMRVPETTGNGSAIQAHLHIPDSEDGGCVHEAFA